MAVYKHRDTLAQTIARSILVIYHADFVPVVDEPLHGKVANRATGIRLIHGRKQRVNREYIVGLGANTNESTQNQVDIGGMVIVMRALKTDDGSAGIRVIVLLQIRVPRGEIMLMRVLSQKAKIVGAGDDRLFVVVQQICKPGEHLRNLEGP